MTEKTMAAATPPSLVRTMIPRNIDEPQRASTPLELLFDLCFVVAIAVAADKLHHAITSGHLVDSIAPYLIVFFAIWWAWMNFTWFASAYDTDDVPYRIATLVQIAGVLILAAGLPLAFDTLDLTIATIGYVVMRLALVAQWLRAARGKHSGRSTALRYAIGISVLQVGWVGLLVLPLESRTIPALLLVACELSVPIIAERAGRSPWNPSHIAERFGLFTLIVLGESVLTVAIGIQVSFAAGGHIFELMMVVGCGLVILFSMWWIYFEHPADRFLLSNRAAIPWAYGHYLVFASAAAVGAGLAVFVDFVTGVSQLGQVPAAAAVAIPVAIFLLSVWALHVRPHRRGLLVNAAFPIASVIILTVPLTPFPMQLLAIAVVALLGCVLLAGRKRISPAGHPLP